MRDELKMLDSGSRFSPGQVSFSRNDAKELFLVFYRLINTPSFRSFDSVFRFY
jgi:hypothetical protein